eukprot:363203-Chlamydomonas_euryale.AAC.17
MDSACLASARAVTWITQGDSSPAILYMLGIMSSRPCEHVNVVASAPAAKAPWMPPACWHRLAAVSGHACSLHAQANDMDEGKGDAVAHVLVLPMPHRRPQSQTPFQSRS